MEKCVQCSESETSKSAGGVVNKSTPLRRLCAENNVLHAALMYELKSKILQQHIKCTPRAKIYCTLVLVSLPFSGVKRWNFSLRLLSIWSLGAFNASKSSFHPLAHPRLPSEPLITANLFHALISIRDVNALDTFTERSFRLARPFNCAISDQMRHESCSCKFLISSSSWAAFRLSLGLVAVSRDEFE